MDNMSTTNAAVEEQADTKKNKPFTKKLVIPTKTKINFAMVGITPMKLSVVIPGVILIILGAALLSKFFVVDRIIEVAELQAEVDSIQSQIDEEEAAIAEMGDIATQYAHYTWSGMTDVERALADRMDAVELIQKYVLKKAKVGSYTISGNEISLPITGVTFNEVGHIVNSLEADPKVDHCEVVAAASEDASISYNTQDMDTTMVGGDMEATAQVTIYMAESDVASDTEPDTGSVK